MSLSSSSRSHSHNGVTGGDNDSLLGDSSYGSQQFASLKHPHSNRRGRRKRHSEVNKEEQQQHQQQQQQNNGNSAVLDDEFEEQARAQMDLVFTSEFDPSIFDYSWMEDGSTSLIGNLTSTSSFIASAPCGQAFTNDKVEAQLQQQCSLISTSAGQQEQCASALQENREASVSSVSTLNFHKQIGGGQGGAEAMGLYDLPILSSADCPPNTTATTTAAPSHAAALQQNMFQHNTTHLLSTTGTSSGRVQMQPIIRTSNLHAANENTLLLLARNAVAAGANPLSVHFPSMPQQSTTTPHELPFNPVQQKLSASKKRAAAKAAAAAVGQISDSSELPPFLLFDAPIELRANFIASQRAHGIYPTMRDNNSLHYQMNGAVAAASSSGGCHSNVVRLIDGRHGNVGHKRVKNAREQQRTQKITDLIDELRGKMERGGWKVGMKSKFHTLSRYVIHTLATSHIGLLLSLPFSAVKLTSFAHSTILITFCLLLCSCAEYVKHLVQANKEKEQALENTKIDLEAKRRKIRDDKIAQHDPSDPESTTSSLTVSSGSANKGIDKSKVALGATSSGNTAKKRGTSYGSSNSRGNDEDGHERKKKARFVAHESSLSTLSQASPGGDNGGTGRSEHYQSEDQTRLESVSDLTDSNKGSSSEGNTSSQRSTRSGPSSDDDDVARYSTDQTSNGDKAAVRDTAKQPNESAFMGAKFELDYEEVFLKSNVPQLLATTSGRIIAWNDFFLKATGLQVDDVSRLTIFSLVRPAYLSRMFEIVAAAIRSGAMGSETSDSGGDASDETTRPSTPSCDENLSPIATGVSACTGKWNYTAITLPCARFRPRVIKSNDKDKEILVLDRLLYITVTLMTDDDPRQRCFHCVFTDCPGADGALRSVTPELLSLLFNQ